MELKPGEMRERVRLERRVISTSGGEQSEAFVDEGTFWAAVKPVRADARTASDIENATETVRFWFRFCSATSNIDTGYVLVWRARNYDVRQPPHLADRDQVSVVAQRNSPVARSI